MKMCTYHSQCSISLFFLVAQYEGSVLVSKVVNLKIDDITLKPAGKNTRAQIQITTQRVFTCLSPISHALSFIKLPTHKHTYA